ncbi:Transcription factor MYB44 [Acorus calamus]|uniref:Transcription factor MYB44 n=1 Tax=Acorus calamus TaxID=4465 RepID=A0AAV9E4L8_ACOCL|nr:Transcription factor MYB44 [Acorus calamus]
MCTRGHWRPVEDEKLKELVERYGPHNWNTIAENLPGRSGKSCRLRWFNQLDPRITRSPFTEEEEERLIASHRIHDGNDSIEFYDFLRVNAEDSENHPKNCMGGDDTTEEGDVDNERRHNEAAVPFIDFLAMESSS